MSKFYKIYPNIFTSSFKNCSKRRLNQTANRLKSPDWAKKDPDSSKMSTSTRTNLICSLKTLNKLMKSSQILKKKL